MFDNFFYERTKKNKDNAYYAKDWNELISICSKFLEKNPNDKNFLHDIAWAYYKQKKNDKALIYIQKILNLEKGKTLQEKIINKKNLVIKNKAYRYTHHYEAYAEILYINKDFNNSETVLTCLLDFPGFYIDKYLLLSKVYYNKKEIRGAVECLYKLRDEVKDNTYDDIILKELRQVTNIDRYMFDAYELIVSILNDKRILNKVKNELEDKKNSSNVSIRELLELGYIYIFQSEFLKAENISKDLSRIDYSNKCSEFMALICIAKQEYSKTLLYFTDFLRHSPNKFALVIIKLKKCWEQTDSVILLEGLVRIYLMFGYIDDAYDYCLKLKEHDKENKETEKKISQIINLQNERDICEYKMLLEDNFLEDRFMKIFISNREIKVHHSKYYIDLVKQKEPDIDKKDLCLKLAKIYAKKPEQKKQAVSFYQRYIKETGIVSEKISYDIALVFLEQNLLPLTKKLLTEFTSYDNNLDEADKMEYLYKIAVLFDTKGDLEEAAKYYEKIAFYDIEFKDVSKRMSQIESKLKQNQIKEETSLVENVRYINRVKIGEGGMGEVYKAYDTIDKRYTAIKEINTKYLSDQNSKQRFLREAQYANKLKHPGIVEVYELNLDCDKPYMALEFIEGKSLREKLESGYKFKQEEVLKICRDLFEILKYAHAKDIIHRDIKPDNVMILANGQLKLMDFGLSKDQTATVITEYGMSLGTSLYMAPEQIKGLEVDPKADQYAVGILAYELLLGAVPFASGDIAYRQVNEEPKDLITDHKIDISAKFNEFIKTCLNKDSNQRFSADKDILDYLSKI